MHHAAPRAVRGTLLFRTWSEARILWDAVLTQVPRVPHLLLMPDHIHARIQPDHWPALQRAMAAYALARNHRRGERGQVWEHRHHPTVIADAQKLRRTDRYILLNPCRAGITSDPLSWPFSTLRETVGLAISEGGRPGARQAAANPSRLMSYLCRDDHVRPGMELLPVGLGRAPSLLEVEAAVSALTRTPAAALRRRGPARTLLVKSCRTLCEVSVDEIGRFVGMQRRAVYNIEPGLDRDVRRVDQVAGSERLSLLEDGDLRRAPGWERYRSRA